MARIFTTPVKEAAAKAWMHDVLVLGGTLTQSQRKANDVYFKAYRNVPATEAGNICAELVNRNFADIDKDLSRITDFKFYPSLTQDSNLKLFSATEAAKAIVYAAECLGLYWDDTIRTPYEISAFQKTLLGDAVYKYGRYISNIKDPKVNAKKAASATATSAVTGQGKTTKASNPYQGPQSANARCLLGVDGKLIQAGQSGQKVFMETDEAICICGTKANVNSKLYAKIRPLEASGAAGNTNKVFLDASHGYGYCTCYFESMAEATSFYDKLVASDIVPKDIVTLELAKTTKVDKNGYFLADTEFGFCAIRAKMLNEEVDEQAIVTEDLGKDWEKATADYTKEELDELHTWMRKD
jgi:hypothetical protein